MRVQFALCAQAASVDRASNRISIFNVIDHIAATTLPINLPAITFVAVLETERNEAANYRGVFTAKLNDKVITQGEVPVSFVNGNLARVLLNLSSVPVREGGILAFSLVIPEMVTAAVQVRVVGLVQAPVIPVIPRV